MPITNEARKDPKVAGEIRMMSHLVLSRASSPFCVPLMAAAVAS